MCRDSNQYTPLHKAALGGHIELVKFLILRLHCDPISKNVNNDTALHLAAKNGHLDIVQFFISDRKCDSNISGKYMVELLFTMLLSMATCTQSSTSLMNKAAIHQVWMKKVLHFTLCAAMKGQLDIVKFLTVEKHCDLMCRDLEQSTPLHAYGSARGPYRSSEISQS